MKRYVAGKKDKNSKNSVFAFYQKLIALRKESQAVKYGLFDDLTQGDGYFAYTRTFEDEQILVVCNFDEPREITNLPDCNYLFGNGGKRKPNGKYGPFEAAVYQIFRGTM